MSKVKEVIPADMVNKRLGKTKRFTPKMKSWEKIRQLKQFAYTFYTTYTQRTCKIRVWDTNEVYLFATDDKYSMKEFNMQRRLKKHILDLYEAHKIDIPQYSEKDVRYSYYSTKLLLMPEAVEFIGVQEFDVNKAYYQCAFNLGYITKEMYDEYVNMPKAVRLRFIGTIATRKRRYTYIKGKMQKRVEVIDVPALRHAWFHICKVVDEAMKYFMELAGEHFLMYYVDGVYVDDKINCDDILAKVKQRFGFDFKTTVVECIYREYNKEKKAHRIMIRKYDDEKQAYKDKPFTIKTPKEYIDDEHGNTIQQSMALLNES